jgi:ornithine carbamoyltransferase
MPKHFLDLHQMESSDLRTILNSAHAMKAKRKGLSKGTKEEGLPLRGKSLALIFERPSTRTRVSFEMAMKQLGGEVIVLNAGDMQLGRGESIADTARVLSRYVDGIMLRAALHDNLLTLAKAATVPVINGLTDRTHPCQVMADLQTLEERKGDVSKHTIAWVGDGNNVAASWVHAVGQLGGKLRLGCPNEFVMEKPVMDWARSKSAHVTELTSPEAAVKDADCVITDAWVSMHDKDGENRHNILASYQVNEKLMKRAKPDAIFMHCLPAHRNEEVTDAVFDGPQSVVLDEAENRMHIQKAILLHCLGGN